MLCVRCAALPVSCFSGVPGVWFPQKILVHVCYCAIVLFCLSSDPAVWVLRKVDCCGLCCLGFIVLLKCEPSVWSPQMFVEVDPGV